MTRQPTMPTATSQPDEADWDNVEQRSLKRWHLVNYLRVFDESTNQLVGHIVDLNEEGAMILAEQPLKTGTQYALRMDRLTDGVITSIHISAKCLWSKQDDDPHFYKLGCSLIEPSEETVHSLKSLIDELKSPEPETT